MVYIYSVEGNIGSGKSTLVRHLKDNLKQIYYENPFSKGDMGSTQDIIKKNIIYLLEPVDEWMKITDNESEPILTKFYKNQEKYAFSFQMMAYISRIASLRKTIRENPDSIIICERSVYTDFNVFAKMLYDDGKIEEVNYIIYKQWFDEFTQDAPITGTIYLKVSPDVCSERITKRNRDGEIIPLEYLKNCSKYHDNWLENFDETKNLIIDGDKNINKTPQIVENWTQQISNYIKSTST